VEETPAEVEAVEVVPVETTEVEAAEAVEEHYSSGFQINLISTEAKNTGILAQSEQFDVTESDMRLSVSWLRGGTIEASHE
jgi:hypothetical protein